MTKHVVTVFSKFGGPLTKRISLAADGSAISDGSACVMPEGTAERARLAGVSELAALIEKLKASQALALGALRLDLPDKVRVVTERKLVNGAVGPNVIARTADSIIYEEGQPAFALLDFDSKGMPLAIAVKLNRCGGFWGALLTVLPDLNDTARVTRRSTSAGLSRSDTGKALPGSDGLHVYVEVQDGGDVERFLRALHERCWLAGLGWMMVGAAGQLLDRSIVDRMVGRGERLVFEGPPLLKSPVKQDKKSRRPIAIDGGALNTESACPPLTVAEQSWLVELKAKEEQRLAPEVAKARGAFIERQAKRIVVRTGVSEAAARQTILRQTQGVLLPDVVLPFDDPDLEGCSVADVLADPKRFEGATLADPLEGTEYGRHKAYINRRADGKPWIMSFAHGRTTYELKYDARSVLVELDKCGKSEVAKQFILLALAADLSDEELEELRNIVAKRSGVGKNTLKTALKDARAKNTAQRARENQQRKLAERRDARPMIVMPFPDGPFLPVMDLLNDVIGKSDARVPQMRDIDGAVTRASKLPVPNTHAFSSSGANTEPEGEAE